MSLRQAVLDLLRNGTAVQYILQHHSISEHDLLQIVANEMSTKLPTHLVEYMRLQEMEDRWARKSCMVSMPSQDAWTLLSAQRDRFRLAMAEEIRRVSGIMSHPEIRPVTEAFQMALDSADQAVSAAAKKARRGVRRGKK